MKNMVGNYVNLKLTKIPNNNSRIYINLELKNSFIN